MESVKKIRLGDKAIPIIIALVAVVIVGIAAAVIHKKQDKVETQRTARVVEVNGPCSILREGATINAIADMPLYSGDTFFSGVNASARIMVDDDKFLYLDAATRINFTASGTPDDTHTMIYIETGSMLTEVKEKLAEGETFDIVTPNTCTAIHGTIPMHTVTRDWEGRTTTTIGFAEGFGDVSVFEVAPDGSINVSNVSMEAHEGASYTTAENATLSAQDAQSVSETGKTADGKVAEDTTLDKLQTVTGEAQFDNGFLINAQAATQRNTLDYVTGNSYESGSAQYQEENLATVQANNIIEEFKAGDVKIPVAVALAESTEPVADAEPEPTDTGGPVREPASEPSQEPATEPSQEPSTAPAPVPAAPAQTDNTPQNAQNIIYVNGVPLTVEEQILAIEEAQRIVQERLQQQAAQQVTQPSASPAPNTNNDSTPEQQPASTPTPAPASEPDPTPSPSQSTTPATNPSPTQSTGATPKESPATAPSTETTPDASPSSGSSPDASPTDMDASPSGEYNDHHNIANGGSGGPAIGTPTPIYEDPIDEPTEEPVGYVNDSNYPEYMESPVYRIDEQNCIYINGEYVPFDGTVSLYGT